MEVMMEPRRAVPNPLALAVLAWLLTEPMHPYELGRRLQTTGQDRHIKYNRGSLYMVVTVYAITDAGRREFHQWIRTLLAEPQDEFPQFTVALSLMSVIPPEESVELLRRRLTALAARAEDAQGAIRTGLGNETPWIFLVEEQHALAMVTAEIDFVTELIEKLSQPDYITAWQEYMAARDPGSDS
jgi:DNA-binding PadR family transcriptional regulator